MTRLPSHLDVRDPRFLRYVHATSQLDQLATGFTWTEGPVWIGDHNCLLFSDIPSQRIMRWSETEGVSLYRGLTHFNNGNTRDRQGRLIGCRHGTRDVARTEYDGSITILAESFNGNRLNSPNDVIVGSDGVIWFTDPTYGILSNFEGHRADPEQTAHHVFRLSPEGDLSAVISDFTQPNGLCLSLDETMLYVAESGQSHDPKVAPAIRQFQIEGERVKDAGTFALTDTGFPDGIRMDAEGNLWSSAADGVHCFAPDGALLGKILVPETVANLAFGGSDGHRLFITATTSLYRIFVDVQGAEPWTRSLG
ncbi:MAG: SMP-30/gluconolactonase/LRE family protein [Pseudomonadota bacterium]